MPKEKVSAIIVAGGRGERFGQGGALPKQLLPLAGRPLLFYSISAFQDHEEVDEVIVVAPSHLLTYLSGLLRDFSLTGIKLCPGGDSRAASVANGFAASLGHYVLVHDGVRPFISRELISESLVAARKSGAAIVALPAQDTLKRLNTQGFVETLDRREIWQAQTPQVFRRDILAAALKLPNLENFTDEASMVEALGLSVALVTGSVKNIKVTRPDDLLMAEALMSENKTNFSQFRIGEGYDTHLLVEGRPLYLACVPIDFAKGLLGHSDADVLAHALADALLGAVALGDIGQHFPDKDPQWQGASGRLILGECMAKVRALGYELVNADLTLIGEAPKISPWRQRMQQAVASALGVEPDLINIKATTTEKCGPEGRGECLSAKAIVLISR